MDGWIMTAEFINPVANDNQCVCVCRCKWCIQSGVDIVLVRSFGYCDCCFGVWSESME